MLPVKVSAEWIPVISGATGAGGAVLAQIVAATATGRREKRVARDRRAEARASAFADEKRDVFVKVLQAIEAQLKDYENFWKDVVAKGKDVDLPTGVLDATRWEILTAEVDLLAPELAAPINACLREFRSMDLAVALGDEDGCSAHDKAVRTRRAELRDAMRVSLNVADGPNTGLFAGAKRRWRSRSSRTSK